MSPAAAAAALPAAYAEMARAFALDGLDLDTIRALQPWFDNAEGDSSSGGGGGGGAAAAAAAVAALPWPKAYAALSPPLPPASVRLLVVPVTELSPALGAAAARAAAGVARLLPPGARVFTNARADLHVTVFHFSHPSDPRPDALSRDGFGGGGGGGGSGGGGGGAEDPAALPPARRPAAGARQLEAELAAAAELVAAAAPFELVVERVVLARSGTLLLLWADPSGGLTRLRAALRNRFPGAPSKQSNIAHTSLFRVTTARPLDAGSVAALAAEAEKWTRQLKGRSLRVDLAWHCVEHEFSTIRGVREVLEVGGGGHRSV